MSTSSGYYYIHLIEHIIYEGKIFGCINVFEVEELEMFTVTSNRAALASENVESIHVALHVRLSILN